MTDPISVDPAWFDRWFDAFGGADHGTWPPAGAVQLAYTREVERIAGVPVRVVRSATNAHTARFDVLGDAPPDALFWRGAMRELGASMLVLEHLEGGSRVLASLTRAPRTIVWQRQLMARSPIVDCTMPFDRWWADRGSHKQTWARRERKLIDRGGATFEVVRTWPEAEAVLDEVFEVEASGWKGTGGTAIRQATATTRFYTELVRWCADEGALRLYLLRIEGEIIAFQLDALHGGVLSMFKIGYRDEHKQASPGQVLQLQILRHAFDDPDVEVFDMLGGSIAPDETKLRFATGVEELHRVRVFAPTPAGSVAWARYVAAPAVRRLVRQVDAAERPRMLGALRRPSRLTAPSSPPQRSVREGPDGREAP